MSRSTLRKLVLASMLATVTLGGVADAHNSGGPGPIVINGNSGVAGRRGVNQVLIGASDNHTSAPGTNQVAVLGPGNFNQAPGSNQVSVAGTNTNGPNGRGSNQVGVLCGNAIVTPGVGPIPPGTIPFAGNVNNSPGTNQVCVAGIGTTLPPP
jgi:hypothetical protein